MDVVEVLLLRIRVHTAVMFDLVQDALPAQFQADVEVRGEVGVVTDAADDVVPVDVLLEEIVGIGRIPLVPAHLGHEVHPPAAESVIRVYVDGMHLHEGAEVVCPGIVAVEGPVRVVGNGVPEPFGRDDTAIVIFVEQSLGRNLFLGLGQFLPAKGVQSVFQQLIHE